MFQAPDVYAFVGSATALLLARSVTLIVESGKPRTRQARKEIHRGLAKRSVLELGLLVPVAAILASAIAPQLLPADWLSDDSSGPAEFAALGLVAYGLLLAAFETLRRTVRKPREPESRRPQESIEVPRAVSSQRSEVSEGRASDSQTREGVRLAASATRGVGKEPGSQVRSREQAHVGATFDQAAQKPTAGPATRDEAGAAASADEVAEVAVGGALSEPTSKDDGIERPIAQDAAERDAAERPRTFAHFVGGSPGQGSLSSAHRWRAVGGQMIRKRDDQEMGVGPETGLDSRGLSQRMDRTQPMPEAEARPDRPSEPEDRETDSTPSETPSETPSAPPAEAELAGESSRGRDPEPQPGPPSDADAREAEQEDDRESAPGGDPDRDNGDAEIEPDGANESDEADESEESGDDGAEPTPAELAEEPVELPDDVSVPRFPAEPSDEERAKITEVLEALLFASTDSLTTGRLSEAIGVSVEVVKECLQALEQRLERERRPYRLRQHGSGWRLYTREDFYPFLLRLRSIRRVDKLTPAALETLAIIAYRQPVIRAEIEAIRGVQVGPMLRALLDRKLIRVTGRADEPGSPLQYGTTQTFLDRFGLKSLKDLPSLKEFKQGRI